MFHLSAGCQQGEGIRCTVERRSMYRREVVWLDADALYAFKDRGFGGKVGLPYILRPIPKPNRGFAPSRY